MPEKLKIFVVEDDGLDRPVVIDGVESVLLPIKAYLEKAEDGEQFYFDIERRDMTREEFEAIPEI